MSVQIRGISNTDMPNNIRYLYDYEIPLSPTPDNCYIEIGNISTWSQYTMATIAGIYVEGDYTSNVSGRWCILYGPNNNQLTGDQISAQYDSTYDITRIYCGYSDINSMRVTGDINDFTSAGHIELDTGGNAFARARAYFDTPDSPTMDVDIFTTGANSNKIITFRWENIQNIPPDMYPASYLVRIGANHTLAPDPSTPITTLATVPYKNNTGENWDGEYQVSYQAALQAQPYESQAYIVERGQMGFKVVLYHHIGEDPGYQIDAEYMFAVKEDGDITDYTDPGQGGTVDVNINVSPNPNGNYNEDNNTNDPENPGQALSVDNLLTHSYALDNAKLVSFGQWLWSNDLAPTLYGNQVSPIENIISCKRIPFDVASQTTANIWIGNINTNISAPIAETTHIQHVCVDSDNKYIHTFT